jgi:hypothetical protein
MDGDVFDRSRSVVWIVMTVNCCFDEKDDVDDWFENV